MLYNEPRIKVSALPGNIVVACKLAGNVEVVDSLLKRIIVLDRTTMQLIAAQNVEEDNSWIIYCKDTGASNHVLLGFDEGANFNLDGYDRISVGEVDFIADEAEWRESIANYSVYYVNQILVISTEQLQASIVTLPGNLELMVSQTDVYFAPNTYTYYLEGDYVNKTGTPSYEIAAGIELVADTYSVLWDGYDVDNDNEHYIQIEGPGGIYKLYAKKLESYSNNTWEPQQGDVTITVDGEYTISAFLVGANQYWGAANIHIISKKGNFETGAGVPLTIGAGNDLPTVGLNTQFYVGDMLVKVVDIIAYDGSNGSIEIDVEIPNYQSNILGDASVLFYAPLHLSFWEVSKGYDLKPNALAYTKPVNNLSKLAVCDTNFTVPIESAGFSISFSLLLSSLSSNETITFFVIPYVLEVSCFSSLEIIYITYGNGIEWVDTIQYDPVISVMNEWIITWSSTELSIFCADMGTAKIVETVALPTDTSMLRIGGRPMAYGTYGKYLTTHRLCYFEQLRIFDHALNETERNIVIANIVTVGVNPIPVSFIASAITDLDLSKVMGTSEDSIVLFSSAFNEFSPFKNSVLETIEIVRKANLILETGETVEINTISVIIPKAAIPYSVYDAPLILQLSDFAEIFDVLTFSTKEALRLMLVDGTYLAVELDAWNDTTKTGVLYATFPIVPVDEDFIFLLVFPTITATTGIYSDQAIMEIIWENYHAVYHMGYSPTGTDMCKDSSGNAFHGTTVNMVSGDHSPGILNTMEYAYDGTSYVNLGANCDEVLKEGTLEIVFKTSQAISHLLSQGVDGWNNKDTILSIGDATGILASPADGKLCFETQGPGTSESNEVISTTSVNDNEYHAAVISWNRDNIGLALDGVIEVPQIEYKHWGADGSTNITVGADGSSDFFAGSVKDVLFSDTKRSDVWVGTVQANLSGTLLSYGVPWLNDWEKRVICTIDNTKIDENLMHFSVPIHLNYEQLFLFTQVGSINTLKSDKAGHYHVTNNGYTASKAVSSWSLLKSKKAVSSGKYYWEVTFDKTSSNGYMFIGFVTSDVLATSYPGQLGNSYGFRNNSTIYFGGTAISYGAVYVVGDVIGTALDLDNGKVWWSINGVWQNDGDPITGANPAYEGVSGTFYTAVSQYYISMQFSLSTQNNEVYEIPEGFAVFDSLPSQITVTKDDGTQIYTEIEQWEYTTIEEITQSSYRIGQENSGYRSAFNKILDNPAIAGAWWAWGTTYQTYGWMGQDFGNVSYAINKYRIYCYQVEDQNAKNWTFEASATGLWAGEEVIFDTVINAVMVAGTWQEYTFENLEKYRYWRLNVTENYGSTSYLSIQEIEMYTAEDGDALLWVSDDTFGISSEVDTLLHLYYLPTANACVGYTEFTGNSITQNVWQDECKGVFHFNCSPAGDTEDAILNSAASALHGTPTGTMLTEDLVNGSIGKAIELDGVDDKISFSGVLFYVGEEDASLIITFNRNRLLTREFLCGQMVSTTDTANFAVEFQADNTILVSQNTNAGAFSLAPNLSVGDTDLHQLMVIRSGGTLTVYLDMVAGSVTQDVTGMEFTDQSSSFSVGMAGSTMNYYCQSTLEQFVFMKGYALSAAYRKAFYYARTGSLISNISSEEINSENLGTYFISAGDFVDFPLQLELSTSCGNNAYDMSDIIGVDANKLFILQERTPLIIEKVVWDEPNKKAIVWVKLSNVVVGVNYISVAYDHTQPDNPNMGIIGSDIGKEVWQNGFKAVYHLSQDPSSGIKDSLGGVDAVPVNMDASNLVDHAIVFNGIDEKITLPNLFSQAQHAGSIDIVLKSTDIVSAVLSQNATGDTNDYDTLLSIGQVGNAAFADGYLGIESTNSDGTISTESVAAINDGTYKAVSYAWFYGKEEFFINEISQLVVGGAFGSNGLTDMFLGYYYATGATFIGDIADVRIGHEYKSMENAKMITAQWHNNLHQEAQDNQVKGVNLYPYFSFDQAHTYKTYLGDAWRAIVSNVDSVHGVTDDTDWYFRDDADVWSKADVTTLREAVIAAIDYDNNKSVLRDINTLTSTEWGATGGMSVEGYFDCVFVLYSTVNNLVASLESVIVNNVYIQVSETINLNAFNTFFTDSEIHWTIQKGDLAYDYSGIAVYAMVTGGNWEACTRNSTIPGITAGMDTTGKKLQFKLHLPLDMPEDTIITLQPRIG